MTIVKYLDKIRKAMTDRLKKLRNQLHEEIDSAQLPKDVKKQLHKDVKNAADENQLSLLQKQVKELVNHPAMLARELAQESEPSHLGKQTPETLTIELFSLRNTKPAFRDKKWTTKLEKITRLINEIKDDRVKQGLETRVRALLSGEG